MILGSSILGVPYTVKYTDGSVVAGGLATSVILPLQNQVKNTVTYGPNNTLTGTFSGGGSSANFPLGG